MQEIETYNDLLKALTGLSPGQLMQPIQIADPPNNGKPTAMAQGIAIGTVGELEFEGARSVIDNKYHADEVVLLIDANPFSEDGAIAYEMKKVGPEGRSVMQTIPIYGPSGQTKREEQRAPKRNEFPAHLGRTCAVRGKHMMQRGE
jgi:hypothetical protein